MAARKRGRYGHRDATMILIGYRHGLRASELCDLQWHQVELNAGRLHVRRSKRGTPSVHPMQGDEIRALRRLQREQEASPHVFASERGGPMLAKSFGTQFARLGERAGMAFPIFPHMLRHACGYALANAGSRYASAAGLARPQEHPAHGPLHRACARSVQGFLAMIQERAGAGLTRVQDGRKRLWRPPMPPHSKNETVRPWRPRGGLAYG